ncbi:MAG: hypothetical protein AB8B73_15245, partial [Ekhidna sp.]
EMARELMWRKYPTDQKGSYFRMFWDKSDSDIDTSNDDEYFDIKELHTWSDSAALGAQEAYPDQLIMVVRAELLEKFPGTQIYAVKRILDDDGDAGTLDGMTHSSLDSDVIMPSFKAKLGEALMLIAFDMSAEVALGTNNTDPDNYGYYFVFQERMGELRFGLDVVDLVETNGVVPTISDWDDMHWNNPSLTDFIDLSTIPINVDNPQDASFRLLWGQSSSRMAEITNQKPIYFRIPASGLIQS